MACDHFLLVLVLRANHSPAPTYLFCERFSSGGRSRRRSGRAAPFRTSTLFRIAVGSRTPYSVRSTRVSFVYVCSPSGYQQFPKKSTAARLPKCPATLELLLASASRCWSEFCVCGQVKAQKEHLSVNNEGLAYSPALRRIWLIRASGLRFFYIRICLKRQHYSS